MEELNTDIQDGAAKSAAPTLESSTAPIDLGSIEKQDLVESDKPIVGSREEINKSLEKANVKPVSRLIRIMPRNVAKSGDVKIGHLLPGVKKSFHVFRNSFGKYITGFSDEELKNLKEYPVWDEKTNKPNKEFWANYHLTLSSTTKMLHVDEDERHMIDWVVAKNHPAIANSESEINSETYFFIVDEEAEAERSNIKLNALSEAYQALQAMGPTERRAFLTLFGVPTKDSSDSVVLLHLTQEANSNPNKFLAYFKDSNKTLKTQITEMIEHGVLRESGSAIYFNDSMIGTGMIETVHWLSEPKNQDVKLKLLAALESKKRT